MSADARFWAPDTLLDATFAAPPYLVAPFLPLGGVGILYGPPGVGKSQLALTLAAAAGAGVPFLAPEYPTVPARTLYVQMDVIAPIQQERLQRAKEAIKGLPIAFITAPGGDGASAFEPMARQPALREGVAFGPQLVVLDTLRDTHLLDENDSKTPSLVYGGWRRLFPEATLLFLHHDRKLQLTNGPVPDRFKRETASGTRAWLAKADCGLHLHDWRSTLTLSFSKVRTCGPQAPLAVRLRPDLLVELAEPTPRHKLAEWVGATTKAQEGKPPNSAEAVEWFVSSKHGSRSLAYELVQELGLPGAKAGRPPREERN